jgi:hypothetical protein
VGRPACGLTAVIGVDCAGIRTANRLWNHGFQTPIDIPDGPVSPRAGEAVTIDSIDKMACTPGQSVVGQVTHENSTLAVQIRFLLENLSKSTSDGFTADILPSGTYDFGLLVPDLTAVDDDMLMSIDLLDQGGTVVAADTLPYTCMGPVTVPTLHPVGLGLLGLLLVGLVRLFGRKSDRAEGDQ